MKTLNQDTQAYARLPALLTKYNNAFTLLPMLTASWSSRQYQVFGHSYENHNLKSVRKGETVFFFTRGDNPQFTLTTNGSLILFFSSQLLKSFSSITQHNLRNTNKTTTSQQTQFDPPNNDQWRTQHKIY